MSKNLLQDIHVLERQAETSVTTANTLENLESVRIEYLGRKGKINELMPLLKNASPEEKKILGPRLNELKETIEKLYATKKESLTILVLQKKDQIGALDVTATTPKQTSGSLHLYTQAAHHLTSLLRSLGYELVDGPEVETEYFNFEALNIPKDHPARDMQDTFWLTLPNLLLRTHTSSVQIHAMLDRTPPMALCSVGRVYRYEATDASHDFMFMQMEGMVIAKHISMANLIGTLKVLLQEFFENKKLLLRVRPGFFPFVEPGIEVDISCPFCTQGCSVCKKTRWIEIIPGGLIHPHVLKSGNIDPKKYRGFAFGCGLTRLVMLKYGINDIRLLHSNKVEFLKQF